MPRYPGGLIRKTPVTPTGPFQDGTAPGMWTLAEATYWTKQGLWPIAGNAYTDPDFENVTLLLPGNGTNGAQNNTFLDSSTNNFTVTRNGDTTQGSFSPYSDLWSNYFDGTGDYLSIPDNAALELGSSNFTIEAWVYLIAGGTTQTVIQKRSSGTVYGGYGLYITSGNSLGFIATSSGSNWEILLNSGTVPINQWNHVAVTRSGSTWKIWLNGAEVGTTTSSITVSDNTDSVGVGAIVNGDQPINGYISNLRIVKGTAVYTSNFTPPTAPLTAISGTSLLTCQSNRFRDASANNFAITVNGEASVSNFAPFNPSAPYSPATNGGSGYFDGTGDYLRPPSNTALAFGTGDFTVECWVYVTHTSNAYGRLFWFEINNAGTAGSGLAVETSTATGGRFTLNYSGGQINGLSDFGRGWNHIAVTRSSGTTRFFVNGVSQGSAADTANYTAATAPVIGGGYYNSALSPLLVGYLSNFRVVKGTAVYTSNFTPPTAPVTAISGTSLLLNFTNAGIVDASAKNDLITVGNAQISTAQSKFGGGSIYFDGTGDYLVAPANYILSGDFTVECWVYATANANQGVIQLGGNLSSTSYPISIAMYPNGEFQWGYQTSYASTSGGKFPINTWIHVALVRNAGITRLYVNGVDSGWTLSVSTSYNISTMFVGVYYTSSYPFNGYIDDLRVTNGIARYTANFTPPTKAFPVQ